MGAIYEQVFVKREGIGSRNASNHLFDITAGGVSLIVFGSGRFSAKLMPAVKGKQATRRYGDAHTNSAG